MRRLIGITLIARGNAGLVPLRLADARLAGVTEDEAALLYRQLVASGDDAASALDALQKVVTLSPEFGAAHYSSRNCIVDPATRMPRGLRW